jgi:hypothetical protein
MIEQAVSDGKQGMRRQRTAVALDMPVGENDDVIPIFQFSHRQGRVYGGEDLAYNLEWLHPNCHRQVHRQGISVDQTASPVEEAFAKA